MSAINNLILMGLDNHLTVSEITEPLVVSVSENQTFNAFILQSSGTVNLTVNLVGSQAKCDIRAVYLASEQNRLNLTLDINHAVSQTISQQKIKGVLTNAGQMDFHGIIRIPRDAQKCEGDQNHRALLLSDNALVRATPELEIYADDVKCAHGSAVGGLDDKQLFYLMSRGIDENTARRLLIHAFIMDLTPPDWTEKIKQWMGEHV